jgi:dUTP pyrophosphatase
MKTRGFETVSNEQWKKDCKFNCNIEDVKVPKRATKKSAGYDFFSPIEFELYPGEEIKMPMGIKAYMPYYEFLDIRPRSGQGFGFYIRLANTTGIIDSDYYNNKKNEGHIWLKIRNESADPRNIFRVGFGEAICQGIFLEYRLADGDSFDEGDDRNGGFGSTG